MARKSRKNGMPEYNGKFPTRLRQLIDESGMSQQEVADIFSVKRTRQSISLYTTGKSKPDYEDIRELAAYFGVSIDWLVGLSDVRQDRRKSEPIDRFSEYFGARIRDQRVLVGYENQNELAKAVGISVQSLSAYEKGRRLPNAKVLRALAEALHCSTDYLTGKDNSREINLEEICRRTGLSEQAISSNKLSKTINAIIDMLESE